MTNDSTYLNIPVLVENLDSLDIKMRARGNFRKKQCYYPPLKWKIGKKKAKGTVLENNRKLKLVLPCLLETNSNDEIVEEYLAYKMYELLSPFHFKTRLITVRFRELRKRRSRTSELLGFVIEDDSKLLKRISGKKAKMEIHPLQHDAYSATVNAFFQYMIANTDYSVRSQHNNKLVYVQGKVIHVPYDFDMSGLVNASYAAISGTQNLKRKIDHVTQRVYKGYKRDSITMDSVRKYFISKKTDLINLVDETKGHFNHTKNFIETKKFVYGFFNIIENDKKYNRLIINEARTY